MMMYDASMSWGDVAGMWMGGGDPSFGGFETGRSIIILPISSSHSSFLN